MLYVVDRVLLKASATGACNGKSARVYLVLLSFLSSLTFLFFFSFFFLCFLQNTLFQVLAHTLITGSPTLANVLVGYGACTLLPPASHTSVLPCKTVSSYSSPLSPFSCTGSYHMTQAGLEVVILLSVIT